MLHLTFDSENRKKNGKNIAKKPCGLIWLSQWCHMGINVTKITGNSTVCYIAGSGKQ